jgi:hypothetical protein
LLPKSDFFPLLSDLAPKSTTWSVVVIAITRIVTSRAPFRVTVSRIVGILEYSVLTARPSGSWACSERLHRVRARVCVPCLALRASRFVAFLCQSWRYRSTCAGSISGRTRYYARARAGVSAAWPSARAVNASLCTKSGRRRGKPSGAGRMVSSCACGTRFTWSRQIETPQLLALVSVASARRVSGRRGRGGARVRDFLKQ